MTKTFKINNKCAVAIFLTFLIMLDSCGIYRQTDSRKIPTNANERVKKILKKVRALKLGI